MSELLKDFAEFEPSSADYKRILDHMADGVYFTDRRRVIGYWNQGAERISGYSANQVIGRACFDNLLQHVNDAGERLCFNACPLAETLKDGKMRQARVYLHHADGHRVPVMVRTGPILDEQGEIVGAVEVFSDNSQLTKAIKQANDLRRKATIDPVAQISNRSFGELQIDAAIHANHTHGIQASLLFIDLDDFKSVNDQYGHTVGDKLLRQIARTLEANIRETDTAVRWGGDEFVLLLKDVGSDELEMIAQKFLALISTSSAADGEESIQRTASIGGTLVQPEDTGQLLVERADAMMYQAKQEGGNAFRFG